jgi:hypothetical protein
MLAWMQHITGVNIVVTFDMDDKVRRCDGSALNIGDRS